VNAEKHRLLTWMVITLASAGSLAAQSARQCVAQGNTHYTQGKYSEALNQYEQALTDNPQAVQPRFNKANAYFRMDDLAQAIDLYREVSAESKDMDLVAKAKYNLGNTYFQRGTKQRDSDLQKAVDDLKTAISHWRQSLDINEQNPKAARNIEVARLIIKDIMDQMNKQQDQQDPNQPQDPNQSQDQQQQPSDQQNQQQDPNQPSDPNQMNNDPNEAQDQEEQEKEEGQDQQDPNQPQDEQPPPVQQDMTAQKILDREQRQKQERQQRQRTRNTKVIRDW